MQGVPSPYPFSYKTSNDPDKPIYAWHARQAYSFVVNGPPGNVLLTLSGKVSASGSGSYVSGAEVAFLDPFPPNPFLPPLPPNLFADFGIETPILSAWSADGVGLGYGSQPIPDPSNLVHPFTLESGSLGGAATISFEVPANTNEEIVINAFAYVYDQYGSLAYALADPQIEVSPLTPNAEQYSVSQSSNITDVPEVDPRGLGAVLSLLGGMLGLCERRLRRL